MTTYVALVGGGHIHTPGFVKRLNERGVLYTSGSAARSGVVSARFFQNGCSASRVSTSTAPLLSHGWLLAILSPSRCRCRSRNSTGSAPIAFAICSICESIAKIVAVLEELPLPESGDRFLVFPGEEELFDPVVLRLSLVVHFLLHRDPQDSFRLVGEIRLRESPDDLPVEGIRHLLPRSSFPPFQLGECEEGPGDGRVPRRIRDQPCTMTSW